MSQIIDKHDNSYKKLKANVEHVTGFVLPEAEPQIGKQFTIPLPNMDVQPEKDSYAVCAYFGNGEVYIKSMVKEDPASRLKDEYHFGGAYTDINHYKEIADRKRRKEQAARALKLYEGGELIDLTGHAVLAKLGFYNFPHSGFNGNHPDYLPCGEMTFGELKSNGEMLLQAFMTYADHDGFLNVDNQNAEITVIRVHSLDNTAESQHNLEIKPSFHIHQLHFGMPFIWTVGLKNALTLKRDFAGFSIIEAYSLEHLFEAMKSDKFKNSLCGQNHFVGLMSAELKALNSLDENSNSNKVLAEVIGSKLKGVSQFEIGRGLHE